jgi:hypothetical protein
LILSKFRALPPLLLGAALDDDAKARRREGVKA